MTRVKSLAASQRPLAEVLIDALRAETKSTRKSLAGSNGRADLHQLDLRLDDADELDQEHIAKNLRPDDAAAAILLGRALDRDRAALAKLQNPDAITIVEVPSTEYVGIVARLIRQHLIGDAPVLEDNSLPKDDRLGDAGTVVIFRRVDEGKTKKSTNDNGGLTTAIQSRCAIIGIATDPDRLLPRDLVRLAEHRVKVPPLDGAAVGAVIEAVTGRHPGVVDDELARRANLENLMIAVRADFGAERSLVRLAYLLDHKAANAEPAPRLSELHGLGPARGWGLALAHDLKDYAAGRLPWAAVARGCVLSGPPGTGKTSFARALAREAGVFFTATSYAQWQAYKEGHLGHITQAIRNTFAEAQQQAPAILFIDEIDTIPARGSGKWNDDWWTAITNCLLEMLDGFERREGVVVIAACNDPSRLDPALVRAGRLDRHIQIPLPDIPGLIGIFRTHLGSDLEGADLRAAALAARGRSGADVERWVRDARRKARIATRVLTLQDLLEAVRGGEPEWPTDVRRRIAYHEAGHAVAMLAVELAEPKSLSIGGQGGMAESEHNEMGSLTRAYIEKHLVVLLGGRASEELVFGEGTAGAGGSAEQSDLGRATKLASEIETSFGLGSYGLVCVGEERAQDLLLFEHLRTAVRGSLDQAYATVLELLAKHRTTLDALAEALFTGGYLDHAEIQAILAKAPLKNTATTDVPSVQPSPPLEADDADARPVADKGFTAATTAP
jgi:cell division protease FtsH